jgi:hypothetical protein
LSRADCSAAWAARRFVEIALRDGAGVPQLPAALEIALRERQARLRRRHLRLGTRHLGRIGGRVDGDQAIARGDQRALAEVYGLNGAGDARAHLDAFDRLEAARELVPNGDVALLHSRHHDRYGRRRGRGGGLRLRFGGHEKHRRASGRNQGQARAQQSAAKG